jgi:pimeloyl-ACP methyl ester carboxylesterase
MRVLSMLMILAGAMLLSSAAQAARFVPGPCPVRTEGLAVSVECGQLIVPENRAKPKGRQVVLPVLIARTPLANKQADPVLWLHGGPGGSALRRGTLEAMFGSMDAVARRMGPRDWIFFDHRGTGLAAPSFSCGDLRLTDAGLPRRSELTLSKACAQRWTAAGYDLSQYNSATIAADGADLMRVLGHKSYNIFGGSYGVRVGLVMMRDFPNAIRAAVLDSPFPPEVNGNIDLPRLVEEALSKVFAACAADTVCAAAYPDLRARTVAFIDQLNAAPKQVGRRQINGDDLVRALFETVYVPSEIPALPKRLARVLSGDDAGWRDLLATDTLYTQGGNLTSFCKEELAFESAQDIAAAGKIGPFAAAIARSLLLYKETCADWPVGPANPVEAKRVVSSIPTLILSGGLDPACPPPYADSALLGLRNGQSVVFPAGSHGIIGSKPCGAKIALGFLNAPTTPIDRSCVAETPDVPKFEVN